MPRLPFPGGKQFAFTVIDDTDAGTLANIRPVYRLLERLGMRTTKTVWPKGCPEGSRDFGDSETLEHPEYREFVLDLQRRGFEVTWHGATMESSTRGRTLAALERFRELFGGFPRIHANHSYNRENVYWGIDRLDEPVLKWLYGYVNGRPRRHYSGHVDGSPFWWGDQCHKHIDYARNLTFAEINLLKVNPSMPYHDPTRPLVRRWFSASDAEGAEEFAALLSPERQARLQHEGGVCIVATHFGKGFASAGGVHSRVRKALESLAERPGWFPTLGELLDWLCTVHGSDVLPPREWRRMQWQWAFDLVRRRAQARLTRSQEPTYDVADVSAPLSAPGIELAPERKKESV